LDSFITILETCDLVFLMVLWDDLDSYETYNFVR